MRASRAIAATAAVLLSASSPAVAQPAPTSPQSQQSQMSDAMVNKVGTALRHVAMIRQEYSKRAQSASSEQQQTLSNQAKQEMLKAISDQGLSLQQYDSAIQMAQNDETLKRRLLSVVQSGS